MKEDCFARTPNNRCNALKVKMCERGNCPFYKPNTQVTRATIEHQVRMYSLGKGANSYG